MKKILLIGAHPASLVRFRRSLIRDMQAQGHTVWAAANGQDPDTEAKLRKMGVEYCPIRVARTGLNPAADLLSVFDLVRLMWRLRPDTVVSYTIKPVIYGGWAARLCGVKAVYSLVTGLGYAFSKDGSFKQRWVQKCAQLLYRTSLRHSRRVFFQNPDDCRAFVELGLAAADKTVVVSGSGVDLTFFSSETRHEAPASGTPLRCLLIARLLKDKGIGEYAAAARKIRNRYPEAEFHLIGAFDPNPAGLKPEQVLAWGDEGLIRFHGQQKDVRPFIRSCDVFVLPSYYREGTPRTCLEAMSMGRAVITTDMPGCRETIREAAVQDGSGLRIGRNGILVPAKDSEALASAMEFFLENPGQVSEMGGQSRSYAEERYDVRKVNEVMLREMELRS